MIKQLLRSRHPAFLAFSLVLVAAKTTGCPSDPTPIHAPVAAWSYDLTASNGPNAWASLAPAYAECGVSGLQSPIDIEDSAPSTKYSAYTIAYSGYGDDEEVEGTLENDGHTIEATYGASVSLADRPSFVWYAATFYLSRIHFHVGSEHTINGAPAAGEMHLVHTTADGTNSAVIAVLMDSSGTADTVLGTFLSDAPPSGYEIEGTTNVDLEYLETLFEVGSYYQYNGSLTTPGCTDTPTVTWFVMNTHTPIGQSQVTAWQALFGPTTARPVQDLGARTVRKSWVSY
ncbi:MAG: carbonic anhydrase family protein [Pseudomonadota bacterium]|nr:carbonic anhydrase family protein [Pseudomonadota bacterium]